MKTLIIFSMALIVIVVSFIFIIKVINKYEEE